MSAPTDNIVRPDFGQASKPADELTPMQKLAGVASWLHVAAPWFRSEVEALRKGNGAGTGPAELVAFDREDLDRFMTGLDRCAELLMSLVRVPVSARPGNDDQSKPPGATS